MALKNSLSRSLAEARLDPRITIEQIENEGYRVRWKRGMPCPNRVLDVENHDLNCTFCKRGFLYDGGREIKALVTSIAVRQMWQAAGRFDVGTAMVTVAPEHRLSWWDTIELLDSVVRYSEVVKRGEEGMLDPLRYHALGMHRLVGDDNTEYEEGVHFNLSNGKVAWILPPEPGTFFAVMYDARPVYVVLDLVHQIRDVKARPTGKYARMPIQGVARLDFMVEAGDKEA